MPYSILNLFEQSHTIDQLVIVGSSRHELVAELLGSSVRKVLRKSNCSLLSTGNRAGGAETTLRAATAVVDAAGKPVKVETDILWGPVSTVLVDESRTATLLCVGSVGADGRTGELLGQLRPDSQRTHIARWRSSAVRITSPSAGSTGLSSL